MKILVTGAAGFLGSHLCDRLLGYEVVGIDNMIGGDPLNVPNHVDLRRFVSFLPVACGPEHHTNLCKRNDGGYTLRS